jgi:hypothetical protein
MYTDGLATYDIAKCLYADRLAEAARDRIACQVRRPMDLGSRARALAAALTRSVAFLGLLSDLVRGA